MYTQQNSSNNFVNMHGPNYSSGAPRQSWNVRSLPAKQQIWPQPTQRLNYNGNSHISRQHIAPSPQSIPSTSNGSIMSVEFRQKASIADWEAYLYSASAYPSRHLTQNPVQTRGNEAVQLPSGYVPAKPDHLAHISIIQNKDGELKPVLKRKRKRTTFSTEQVQILENIFNSRPYVSREERKELTDKLHMSDKTIKVWFQNKRLKAKKEKEDNLMESSDSETDNLTKMKSLAHVEALMSKADDHGYVTLDERAMNELVSYIDALLPQNLDLGTFIKPKPKKELVNSAFYEPISPPDFSESTSEDALPRKWELFGEIDPYQPWRNPVCL